MFEVKRRAPRKARNPRTGDKVDVPPKNVVTFKPGKIMEERVRKLKRLPTPPPPDMDDADLADESGNGMESIVARPAVIPMTPGAATATAGTAAPAKSKRAPRPRKTT